MCRKKILEVLALTVCFTAMGQVNVLTYHNDNQRTGQNLNETTLTPANVNSASFGKLFSYDVDGDVYAQPLYVSGLNIPGKGTHNVVFVATQHNSVYAFDADSNSGADGGLLWQVNFGPSAATPSAEFGNRFGGFNEIVPEVGITGTPVIDPGSGTLYVDAFTHEGTNYFHRLHALDMTDGSERPFSPVVVSASVPGTGAGSTNGVMAFQAKQQLQRGALTLANGILYVPFAGYADTDPFHGWIIGFNPANLQQLPDYVFNSTPNSTTADFGDNAGEGGIWMAGCGVSVDAGGNLFFATGNGSFNAFSGSNGTEYANSFIKLSTAGELSVADYFTPFNQAFLGSNDLDVGSGGLMLLPDQGGPFPHLLVGGGKNGVLYVLNRDQMTPGDIHYNDGSNSDPIVQSLALGRGIFGTPAWFNGKIYFAASRDALKSFSLNNGQFNANPDSIGPRTFPYPGSTPAISADGNANGIVWTLQRSTPAVLAAYDANNLSTEIYNSDQAGKRDQLPGGVKFAVPTIANGKVYIGGQHALTAFGLVAPSDPPPENQPSAGTYSGLFFEASGPELSRSGSFTTTTTTRGTYSGKLQMSDGKYSFKGQFDSGGATTTFIPRKRNTPLQLTMQLDVSNSDHLTGTITDGNWSADLIAYRSVSKTKNAPNAYASTYNLTFEPPSNDVGNGHGTLAVKTSGHYVIRGMFSNRTKFSQNGTISADGGVPFYVSLRKGAGQFLGWLNITDSNAGQVNWIQQPNTKFPSGLNLDVSVTSE